MIWDSTLEAIQRTGYHVRRAPGRPSAKLGEGAFATVFYAEHVVNKRPAAIKICHNEDKSLVASFKWESETLESPDFPGEFAAATYLCCREPGAQPFLVLEYIRGRSIDQYIADNQPSLDARIELLEQLLLGVRSLHERNITHRDLRQPTS